MFSSVRFLAARYLTYPENSRAPSSEMVPSRVSGSGRVGSFLLIVSPPSRWRTSGHRSPTARFSCWQRIYTDVEGKVSERRSGDDVANYFVFSMKWTVFETPEADRVVNERDL